MPNIEWDVAHTLLTPGGNIDINAVAGLKFQVQADSYKIVPALRVTQDNISQADGSVLHPRWKTGLVATMRIAYWLTADFESDDPNENAQDEPACGQELRLMHESLVSALNSIRRLTGAAQRLTWQPTGYGDVRMLDQIQLLSWPDPQYDLDGREASVTFAVETPFPYAIDATEIDTPIADGDTEIVANVGNAGMSPVIIVDGPSSGFTITNLDDVDEQGNPLEVVYDSTRPGALALSGSQSCEIDFFRGTIYRGPTGGPYTINLVAGIDPTLTDYFHIVRGNNRISIAGAGCTVLSNNAWA